MDTGTYRVLACDVFLARVTAASNDPEDRWPGSRAYFDAAVAAGLDRESARDLAIAVRFRQNSHSSDGDERGWAGSPPAGILRGGKDAT